jgi:enhancer of mRNA-decapping protein 3
MASEFIGYNVLVSLRAPPGGKLQGEVADVIGQNLLLHNGMSEICTIYALMTD